MPRCFKSPVTRMACCWYKEAWIKHSSTVKISAEPKDKLLLGILSQYSRLPELLLGFEFASLTGILFLPCSYSCNDTVDVSKVDGGGFLGGEANSGKSEREGIVSFTLFVA